MLKLAPDGGSVSEVWRNAMLDPKMHGVVVLDGRIYGAGDRNRRFFCLDWKTGKELFVLNQLAPANIISNDGLLYIYSENGTSLPCKAQGRRTRHFKLFQSTLGCRYSLGPSCN